MSRARVIVADADINYIMPFQLKFAEDFSEKIDLEVVTEETFFREMFLKPQKADILLVSDSWYDPSLRRHDISHIFVLTEQPGSDDENGEHGEKKEEPGLHYLFKYTSIRGIFNAILSRSSECLTGIPAVRKETQLIVVCSGCGGTGKTTVALGLSACLDANYRRTFYLNAARLQIFQHMLQNRSPVSEREVYMRLNDAADLSYDDIRHVVRREGFSYLPGFRASLMSLGMSFRVYGKIISAVRRSKEYDCIVVDTDVIFDEEKAALIDRADKVIVVTGQNRASVYATDMLLKNLSGINGEKYIFVCNDFRKNQRNTLNSPEEPAGFTVSEYIDHLNDYDSMTCGDLAALPGIQKIAFLVL
mgnify:CR=1 FL=1